MRIATADCYNDAKKALWDFERGADRLAKAPPLGAAFNTLHKPTSTDKVKPVGNFERVLFPMNRSGHFWMVEICIDHCRRTVEAKLFESYHGSGYLQEAATILFPTILDAQAIKQLETQQGYRVSRKLTFADGATKLQCRGGPCGLYVVWWALKRLCWNVEDDRSMWTFPVENETAVNETAVDDYMEDNIRTWLRDAVYRTETTFEQDAFVED